MDRDQTSADALLRRVALEYMFGQQAQQRQESGQSVQTVPVNIYETDGDVVIVVPMPGVEADNIDIEVVGSTVTLRASMRGPGQTDRSYLVNEWTYGPYERTVGLPMAVDALHANASHSNGILVLSLPKADRTHAVRIPLEQATSSEARHRGHSGHHTTRQGLEGDR